MLLPEPLLKISRSNPHMNSIHVVSARHFKKEKKSFTSVLKKKKMGATAKR